MHKHVSVYTENLLLILKVYISQALHVNYQTSLTGREPAED